MLVLCTPGQDLRVPGLSWASQGLCPMTWPCRLRCGAGGRVVGWLSCRDVRKDRGREMSGVGRQAWASWAPAGSPGPDASLGRPRPVLRCWLCAARTQGRRVGESVGGTGVGAICAGPGLCGLCCDTGPGVGHRHPATQESAWPGSISPLGHPRTATGWPQLCPHQSLRAGGQEPGAREEGLSHPIRDGTGCPGAGSPGSCSARRLGAVIFTDCRLCWVLRCPAQWGADVPRSVIKLQAEEGGGKAPRDSLWL